MLILDNTAFHKCEQDGCKTTKRLKEMSLDGRRILCYPCALEVSKARSFLASDMGKRMDRDFNRTMTLTDT